MKKHLLRKHLTRALQREGRAILKGILREILRIGKAFKRAGR